jgi:hypothetical protein
MKLTTSSLWFWRNNFIRKLLRLNSFGYLQKNLNLGSAVFLTYVNELEMLERYDKTNFEKLSAKKRC